MSASIASDTVRGIELDLINGDRGQDTVGPAASLSASPSQTHSQTDLVRSATEPAASSAADKSETGALAADNNLPPIDGGRGAWLYLTGAVLTEALSFGLAYSQGTFLAYHQTNPSSPFFGRASPSALSAVGSIMTGMTFAMPYLAHGFFQANAHLVRKIYTGATALIVACLIASSFLPGTAAPALILFQGVIPGICGGLTFLPCQMWLSQWFDKRRSAAAAIMYLGSGVGGIVFPLIFDALLKTCGFRWTLRGQAVIQLLGGLVVLQITHPRLPIAPRPNVSVWSRSQLRRYVPGSWAPLLCVTGCAGGAITFLQAAAWTAISLYLSTLCISIGLSETTANGILAAYNGSAVLSFMIVAATVDRLSTGTLMAISTAGCSMAAYLLLGFATNLGIVLPFVLLFGVLGAGFSTFVITMARTIVERYQRGDFTQLSCIFILIRGLGATVGPLIASVLYDVGRANEAELWGGHGMKRLIIFSGSVMSGVAAMSFAFRQQLRWN